ncbi:hypothetical protein IO356_001244 [Campylobacter upsaliensis]|nr:hypothetical protein [Campylobacter upsaliensis]
MSKVIVDIKKGFSKTFINAICNHNNELVLEYLKNGMSATKESLYENAAYAKQHFE